MLDHRSARKSDLGSQRDRAAKLQVARVVICFGQQPCGFFPKRFLIAKLRAARRLQSEQGGEVVFFFHDSDHDHRETVTSLRDLRTKSLERINFEHRHPLQKRHTPLYLKGIADGWVERTARRLPRFVPAPLIDIFTSIKADKVGEFCLEMYEQCGLLQDVRVVRSSDPEVRRRARSVTDFFVDVEYQGQPVRARHHQGSLRLHRGGENYIELPQQSYEKHQVSPTWDTRLLWMQSVIGCTHYIAGASEQEYLKTEQTPEVTFLPRDVIEEPHLAYIPDV